jgi:ribosome biogenesis GTPase
VAFDLASLGWGADLAAAYARHNRADQRPARVAGTDRGICTVLSAAGTERASLGGQQLVRAGRDPVELPCPGDWVVLREWPDQRTTIEVVLPRRTCVLRADAGEPGFGQALVANVDVAALIEPLRPTPDRGRLRRLLSLAAAAGARPLVVLTKADVVPAAADRLADLDVPVVIISARLGTGLDALAPYLRPGTTLGLFGAPGSGKSTLVSVLAGATVIAVPANRFGKYPTARPALVPLPTGGSVLDTPGFRPVTLRSYPRASGS